MLEITTEQQLFVLKTLNIFLAVGEFTFLACDSSQKFVWSMIVRPWLKESHLQTNKHWIKNKEKTLVSNKPQCQNRNLSEGNIRGLECNLSFQPYGKQKEEVLDDIEDQPQNFLSQSLQNPCSRHSIFQTSWGEYLAIKNRSDIFARHVGWRGRASGCSDWGWTLPRKEE